VRHRVLAPVLVALIVAGAQSAGASPHSDPATRGQAHAVLAHVEWLGRGNGVRTGRELSPALGRLYASLPALSPGDRERAEAILARPDDTQSDAPDTHKWTVPEAVGSPDCVAHFCVHWVAFTADAPSLADTSPANGVPDYVEQMARILENEVFPCENGTGPTACAGAPGLGWREPAPDSGHGGNDKTDVYIEDLYTNERVFGYVASDPGQARDPAVPHSAYMVLDKDYSRYAHGDAAGGLAAERVTAAHEYNHVLQDAYDYIEDGWMFESTAVYMEDKVYPQVNDYLHYVAAWASNTKQPLTAFPSGNLKPYGSAVWNHWLDHRYGAGVVRSAWERSVGSADFAPGAYGAAIAAANGLGFADEFARFSAAVAEWNVPGSGFPDPYPDIPRDGILPAGSQTTPFTLPHTTFAFFDVPIPDSAPPLIRLIAAMPGGTSGAVALVGRTGPDLAGGTVISNLTPLPSGGTGVVQLDNPASFGRITAVVVNSDVTRSGFDSTADDYIFTRDAQNVVAAVVQPEPPIVTTGSPGTVADHSAVVSGAVDPRLIDTTWLVEYGRTGSYGSSTTPQPLPASTVGAATLSTGLADLKADTTYHYRLLASNTAGAAAGADMTFTTARDVTRPLLSVTVKRQKLRTVRTRGALYLGRCSERCLGTAELRLGRAMAKKLGLPVVLGRARVTLAVRPASSTLHVRLARRVKRALAGSRRQLRLTLWISVADQSRNRTTVTRQLVVVP
jgi:hypothetical protein